MEITYKYYSTFEMNEKEKNDFIKVFNEVFNENWTLETFNRKYIDNIYGNSHIIIAYDNNLPVGIRSYWRNDLYKAFPDFVQVVAVMKHPQQFLDSVFAEFPVIDEFTH